MQWEVDLMGVDWEVDLLGVDLLGIDFVRVDVVGGHPLNKAPSSQEPKVKFSVQTRRVWGLFNGT